MKEIIRVLLIDVHNSKCTVEYVNDWHDYSNLIGCDWFEVYMRKLGDKVFTIYCDSIGRILPDAIPSGIDTDYNVAFCGNLVIEKTDKQGGSVSLTDEDISYINQYLRTGENMETGHKYPVLVDIDY